MKILLSVLVLAVILVIPSLAQMPDPLEITIDLSDPDSLSHLQTGDYEGDKDGYELDDPDALIFPVAIEHIAASVAPCRFLGYDGRITRTPTSFTYVGNVSAIIHQYTIRADRIDYDSDTGVVVAEGNVFIHKDGSEERILAKRFEWNDSNPASPIIDLK